VFRKFETLLAEIANLKEYWEVHEFSKMPQPQLQRVQGE